MFIDLARMRVKGGAGGAGAVAFRRERHVPRGGPAGGNGGRGGSVILAADPQMGTLLDYSYRDSYAAGRAQHGEGKNKTGADGEDLILPVPLGTVVRDADTSERIGELLADGDRIVVARGGRGGRGNASFASPTHQAPREWEPGEWGQERRIEFELKLIADIGLVGEPNAGKSTFLASVSAARPKVADYPFTTLKPNLGVVPLSDGRSFVLADIPGLIEGAHSGRGLGTQFLRHIERTRTLAVVVPADSPDPQATYELLRQELAGHDSFLAGLPHCVILSKCDLSAVGGEDIELEAPDAWATFRVSAVSRTGLPDLLESLWERVQKEKVAEDPGTDDDSLSGSDAWAP